VGFLWGGKRAGVWSGSLLPVFGFGRVVIHGITAKGAPLVEVREEFAASYVSSVASNNADKAWKRALDDSPEAEYKWKVYHFTTWAGTLKTCKALI
jgi:hypothetical protein